jgi:hypothetical protein
MSCPEWIGPHHQIFYDWLSANGIDEWIPEDPLIQIVGREIRYLSFVWANGERGWDMDRIVVDDYGAPLEERRVPLVRPVDDVVLAAAREGGAVVVIEGAE